MYFCLSEWYIMQGMLLASETRGVDSSLDPGGALCVEIGFTKTFAM